MKRMGILDYVIDRARVAQKNGVSRQKLADKAHVSKSWLDKVMAGSRDNPQIKEVQRLIYALDEIEQERKAAG